MRWRLILVCAVIVLVAVLSTGCLFNIFQTARAIGGGNVAITIGAGVLMLEGEDEATGLAVTPQARLTLGLADAVDLGLQTGALVPFSGTGAGWLGAIGDLKFCLFDEPDAFALALGFGAAYGAEYLGWGVFGEVLFDSNLRVLPIYFVYQPGVPFAGGTFGMLHHIAGGLKLQITDKARILIQADYRAAILSVGFAFDIGL